MGWLSWGDCELESNWRRARCTSACAPASGRVKAAPRSLPDSLSTDCSARTVQPPHQCTRGPAAVADRILLRIAQLRHRLVARPVVGQEHRVIAKPPLALRLTRELPRA